MKARPTSTATTSTHLQDLEAQVHTVMAESNVPGLALLILKDGEVVLSRGFGKRNVAAGLPVTPRTLFPIGSSSKAFTAAAIAMLVEEGKLEWDKPVRHYLPSFKLHDPFASERMTPRDLLCHRSGLPRHEIMWYNALFTRKEMVERLQYLEPSVDFRVVFQYQNLMYATAGYLIECVTGKTWEEFVAERIFKPLGMDRTNTSVHDSQQTDDYALPYAEEEGEVKEIPFYDRVQATGPAGSINSSLEDIKHWLLFQLNNGKHGETQLLAAEQLAQNHTPQMLIPASPILNFQESSTSSYGMGWEIGAYRGHRMLQHGGSINGFAAQVVLLPDDQAALAVFTNLGGTLAPYAVAFYACDYLLGVEAPDWNGRWKEELAKLKALGAQQAAELAQAERVPDAPPSHPLEAYTGTFEHPGYGVAVVTLNDRQLYLTYNDVTAPLTHFHYDLFEMFIKLAQYKAKVSFTTGETGAIESLAANLEPAVKAIVFTRVASKEEQKEPAEREQR
jgi:CubicO group peptidase (beta-lactamase class C family)